VLSLTSPFLFATSLGTCNSCTSRSRSSFRFLALVELCSDFDHDALLRLERQVNLRVSEGCRLHFLGLDRDLFLGVLPGEVVVLVAGLLRFVRSVDCQVTLSGLDQRDSERRFHAFQGDAAEDRNFVQDVELPHHSVLKNDMV